MELISTVRGLQSEIDSLLEAFLAVKEREAAALSPLLSRLAADCGRFVLNGGKRLRPILFYYGYLAGGGTDRQAALEASLAIEFIHDYLLVHDDIMDEDRLRRGQPTMHALYEARYSSPRLGESAAIMAGDLLASYGYEALTSARIPEGHRLAALAYLNRLLAQVFSGQALDVFSLVKGQELAEEDIMRVAFLKTATYTIEGPLALGYAAATGSVEPLRGEISSFASSLGIAYQLQDDILGLFGDERVTGKTVGTDVRQGKRTLLILHALEHIESHQKAVLEGILGKPGLAQDDIETARRIVKESGALEYCLEKSSRLSAEAKDSIRSTGLPDDTKDFLAWLADYLVKREK